MQGHINIGREDWVKSEYGFDLPCVTILIPRRIGIEYLRNISREPDVICSVITELIEKRYPILKGCVVCSFSLDPMQYMWSCYVVHNCLKRVPLGQCAPIVRMTQENTEEIILDGQLTELPINDDYMQPEIVIDNTFKPTLVIDREQLDKLMYGQKKIVITDNKGPKFKECKAPYEFEEMTEPGKPYISNTE